MEDTFEIKSDSTKHTFGFTSRTKNCLQFGRFVMYFDGHFNIIYSIEDPKTFLSNSVSSGKYITPFSEFFKRCKDGSIEYFRSKLVDVIISEDFDRISFSGTRPTFDELRRYWRE